MYANKVQDSNTTSVNFTDKDVLQLVYYFYRNIKLAMPILLGYRF